MCNIRTVFLLAILFLPLGGCLSIEDVTEDDFEFPTEHAGIVPETFDAPPTGQWHAHVELDSAALWVVEVGPGLHNAGWAAQWTPDETGGYIALSGIGVDVVRENESFSWSSGFAWARKSDDQKDYQSVVSARGKAGYLALMVEPFNATGTLDVLINWGEGPAWKWEPTVVAPPNEVVIEEYDMASVGEVERTLDMSSFNGLHVVTPCRNDHPEPARYYVEIGDSQPYWTRGDGKMEDNGRRNWLSYAGFWTYDPQTAKVQLEYEGEGELTAAVIRSDTDWKEMLRQQVGVRPGGQVIAQATSSWCEPVFLDDPLKEYEKW